MTNRHIVDQLADVSEQIKALDKQKDALRALVIDSIKGPLPDGETREIEGDEYTALVMSVTSERLDRKEVEKMLSKPKFEKCLKSSTAVQVRVARKS